MGNQCCPSSYGSQTAPGQQTDNFQKLVHLKNIQTRQIQPPKALQPKINQIQKPTQNQQMRVIELPDGSKYTGMTKLGIPNGHGTQIHQQGDQYIGNFMEGVKQGYGIYKYSNGIVYQGNFNKGQMHGNGKIKFTNGDWYEGEFKNNIINGYGKYYSKQSNSYYQGTYLDGKRHGRGKIIGDNSILQGYWELGQFKYRKPVQYNS